MTATDRLRQAAQKIRDTANAATQGAWFADRKQDGDESGPLPYDYITGDVLSDDGQERPEDVVLGALAADAALIALTANPPLVLDVADLLDRIAEENGDFLNLDHPAMRLAGRILGGDQ